MASNPSSAPSGYVSLIESLTSLSCSVCKKWLMVKTNVSDTPTISVDGSCSPKPLQQVFSKSTRVAPASLAPRALGGVLTLGIGPVWGLGWQLLDVLLEQQLVAWDSLHRFQHVMLQRQAA